MRRRTSTTSASLPIKARNFGYMKIGLHLQFLGNMFVFSKYQSGSFGLISILQVVPEGFRGLLNWVKDKYNNPMILVTENGYADAGLIDDVDRISYYKVKALELNFIFTNCNFFVLF